MNHLIQAVGHRNNAGSCPTNEGPHVSKPAEIELGYTAGAGAGEESGRAYSATLYLGLRLRNGTEVSPADRALFVDTVVAKAFLQGFTFDFRHGVWFSPRGILHRESVLIVDAVVHTTFDVLRETLEEVASRWKEFAQKEEVLSTIHPIAAFRF